MCGGGGICGGEGIVRMEQQRRRSVDGVGEVLAEDKCRGGFIDCAEDGEEEG